MRRLGALALALMLIFTAASCGCAPGERRALALARGWDEQRLGQCRYEAACAGRMFTLSVRPERPGAEGLSAGEDWSGPDSVRGLYESLRSCLGGEHDILIALYATSGALWGTYLNGEPQRRAAM